MSQVNVNNSINVNRSSYERVERERGTYYRAYQRKEKESEESERFRVCGVCTAEFYCSKKRQKKRCKQYQTLCEAIKQLNERRTNIYKTDYNKYLTPSVRDKVV